MDSNGRKANDCAFSISKGAQVLKIAKAKDFGYCKAYKKDSMERCKCYINTANRDYCDSHVRSEYRKKMSRRMDLNHNQASKPTWRTITNSATTARRGGGISRNKTSLSSSVYTSTGSRTRRLPIPRKGRSSVVSGGKSMEKIIKDSIAGLNKSRTAKRLARNQSKKLCSFGAPPTLARRGVKRDKMPEKSAVRSHSVTSRSSGVKRKTIAVSVKRSKSPSRAPSKTSSKVTVKEKSKEAKSKEAKSKEVKSKEVKSKEVKSKEVKRKEAASKEAARKEVTAEVVISKAKSKATDMEQDVEQDVEQDADSKAEADQGSANTDAHNDSDSDSDSDSGSDSSDVLSKGMIKLRNKIKRQKLAAKEHATQPPKSAPKPKPKTKSNRKIKTKPEPKTKPKPKPKPISYRRDWDIRTSCDPLEVKKLEDENRKLRLKVVDLENLVEVLRKKLGRRANSTISSSSSSLSWEPSRLPASRSILGEGGILSRENQARRERAAAVLNSKDPNLQHSQNRNKGGGLLSALKQGSSLPSRRASNASSKSKTKSKSNRDFASVFGAFSVESDRAK
eukprot:1013331-Amorphochlora_amoeboformis.AAC.1